jgi:proline racemase
MKAASHPRRRDDVHDLVLSDIAVGGDIHRVVLGGIRTAPGIGARDLRSLIQRDYDALRQMLLSYPYGDPDMCADLLFETGTPGVDYGYVVMECMGYPYFSGSNTMAVMAGLVEYGLMPDAEGSATVRIEAPSGPIEGRTRIEDGRLEEVVVEGDAAYVIDDGLDLDLPGLGRVPYALVWSGAVFVMLDARDLGVAVDESDLPRMKEIGRAAIEAIRPGFAHEHPEIGPVDPPGFVHFTQPLAPTDGGRMRGRGATYGHPATVFKCPTGTGTAARMALAHARGEIDADTVVENVSAHGNLFVGRTLGLTKRGGRRVVATSIAAKPYVLTTATLHLDFDNPLMAAYQDLRALVDG